MKMLRRIWGKILYVIASMLSWIFDIFINIVAFIITIIVGIGKGLLAIVSMGGCLLVMILGPALLLNPITFMGIVFLIVFPLLGTKFVSYLKYIRYALTEYLFDHADSLIHDRRTKSQSFNEYGNRYRRMEEEKRRKEQQQRQEAQQREWEKRFRQWSEYQSYQGNSGYYQGDGGYHQGYANPNIDFKNKYEKSCDLLGIPYDSDKYQIKLAYRKKAKEYHPDLNKSPNATQKFQQINEAYEFLNDINIERYKNH